MHTRRQPTIKSYLVVASGIFCVIILLNFLIQIQFFPFLLKSFSPKKTPMMQQQGGLLPLTRPLLIFTARPSSDYSESPHAWWAVEPDGERHVYANQQQYVAADRGNTAMQLRLDFKKAFKELTGAEHTEIFAINGLGTQAIITTYDYTSSDAAAPSKVTLSLFDKTSGKSQEILRGGVYDDCTRVVGWNEAEGILYAVTERPISSESYVTHFCTITIGSGKRSAVRSLPFAQRGGFRTMPYVDEQSGKAVFIDGAARTAYHIEFSTQEVKKIAEYDGVGLAVERESLVEGVILLFNEGTSYYEFYDIRNNRVADTPFQFHDADGVPTRVMFVATTKNHSLFVKGFGTGTRAFYVVDRKQGEVINAFYEDSIAGKNEQLRFEGWIE